MTRSTARDVGRWPAVLAAALVSLGLVFCPGAARADVSAGDMREAQKLFDEGINLFNQGKFADACPRFEASLAIFPGIGTRGKLAECYERQGRTASAYRLYLEVAKLAKEAGDDQRSDVAAERAETLAPQLARLIIKPGPSAGVPGFSVRRNDHPVDARIYGQAQIVDPGTQVIAVSAPGHASFATTAVAKDGATTTVTIPALDTVMTTQSTQRFVAVGLFGAGAITLLGGTTYFGIQAQSRWNMAFDDGECNDDLRCTDRGLQLVDDARSSANLANVSAIVGILSIGAGAYLWWRAGQSRTEQTSARPARSLVLGPHPGGLGISILGSF